MLLQMINDMIQLDGTPTDNTAILKRYTDKDEHLKILIGMMYDPLIRFGIKISYDEFNLNYFDMVEDDIYRPNELMELLLKLSNNQIKGKAKRAIIYDFINNNGSYIVMFLRRSLDLQIGISTIKKLGIISQYSLQKGILLNDLSKVQYPLVADWKYNGSRLTITVSGQEQKVTCKLLKGRVIKIPLLEDIIKLRSNMTDYVLDGELTFNGGITEADRLVISGLITSATSTYSDMPFTGLKFIAYDVLKRDDFENCRVDRNATYVKRRAVLMSILRDISHEQVIGSANFTINNISELQELMGATKSEGGEGLMLKPLNSLYMYTKNSQWYKLKNMQEADLTIVGYKPHTRDNRLIGSLACEGYINGFKVQVNTGSGLNEADRPIALMDKYLGKIVEVTYLEVLSHSNGTYSLSNPRFVKPERATPLLDILRDGKIDANNINY